MSLKGDSGVDGPLQDRTPLAQEGRPMSESSIAATFVRCVKCSREFRSSLAFKTLHDFERASRIGFIAQCPSCYTIFDCNSSNTYCEMAPAPAPYAASNDTSDAPVVP